MTESPFFPVADQLRDAPSHRERAAMLLRLSDTALLGGQVDMVQALEQVGFAAGQSFMAWRVAALCRTRDAHGLMPDDVAQELEFWREAMSRFAVGAETAPDREAP